jgi:parallel beta-helix repeat protein
LSSLRWFLGLALLLIGCVGSLCAQPCTRYASPNGNGDGLSQGSPYRISNFVNSSPAPGSVLCLLDGTYTSGLDLGSSPSGAPGSPITMRALNDGGAYINGQDSNRVMFMNGTSYWTIIGIDFGNGGSQYDGVASFTDTHHITVQRSCFFNTITPWPFGIGSNSHTFGFNNSHDNVFEDICVFGQGRNSFIMFEDGTKNNVFRRFWLRWDGYPDNNGAQCPGGTLQVQYHTHHTNDIYENFISLFSGNQYAAYYTGPSDPNHFNGFPCPSFGAGWGTRGGIVDPALPGAQWIGYIGYGYPDHSDLLAPNEHVGLSNRWGNITFKDIFMDGRYGQNGHQVVNLYACDLTDPNDNEAGIAGDCSRTHEDRITSIRNSGQPASTMAPVGADATNLNECTSLGACPNFYTGTSPGTGSRSCFEYQNGTLTSTPLWPWRMDDRIKQALTRSGIGPTLQGVSGSGYGSNTVTSEIVSRYGAVPSQCSRATTGPQPPVITSSLSASGLVSTPFSYQITATNTPTSYGATGLPAGLSVNTGTGLISGTPTLAGSSSVTISATNATGTGTAVLTLTITTNVLVREIPFGPVNTTGKAISSCWGGLGKDSSSRLYFAMGIGTPESDDVAMFQYTPVTGGGIGTRTFLDTLKHVTQLESNFDANETIAKVHVDIMQYGGKLYFASHDFHDVSPGYHRGAHFFSYDPVANHFEDLSKTDSGGVSVAAEGIIGMDIMLPQAKLIGFTYKPGDGGNVVAYDLGTRTSVTWPGNSNPDGGVTRRIFTSHDQLAYISYGTFAGPQQIYAMNVTNGTITAPGGMTLRTAQIIATAHATDGDRVFLLNWDGVYLWHTTSKTLDALVELFPPSDRGRGLLASNIVLSRDETQLYTLAEGYLDNGPTYVWRLYQINVATGASLLLADLTSQMMTINGGTLGGFIGAVLDAQGRMYSCGSEGFVLELSGLPASGPPPPPPITPTTYYTAPASLGGSDANPCSGAGGNNAQSTAFPKLTIAGGLSCVVSGNGDTLVLRNGTYVEGVTNLPSGASTGNPTTLKAESTGGAILQPASSLGTGFHPVLAIAGRSHIVIDGLVLDATGSNTGGNITSVLVDVSGASDDIRILNNEMRNLPSINYGTQDGAGIRLSTGHTNAVLRNNHIHHLAQTFNDNNIVGIEVTGDRALIEKNLIHDIQYHGILQFGGSTGNIFRSNVIHDTKFGGGIELQASTDALVYNNIIYTCAGNGFLTGVGASVNTGVYNNTIVGCTLRGIRDDSTSANKYQNNILYQNTAGNAIVAPGGATITPNLITTDPQFVNQAGGDYHIKNTSPALDAGVVIPAVADDFEGNTRPQGTAYDLGADEFIGAAVPATYYVAPNGNDAVSCQTAKQITTPKVTIAGGLGCAQSGQGDTVFIRAGTYAEHIDTQAQTVVGGSDWNTATLIANYQNEVVTLSPSGSGPILRFDQTTSHYIIVSGLVLDAGGTLPRTLMIGSPAHHIRVQNSTHKNATLSMVVITNSDGNEFLGNTLVTTPYVAIYLNGTSQANIIQANTVSGWGSAALYVENTSGAHTISGNWFHNPTAGSTTASIHLQGAGGNLVKNNIMSNGYGGIHLLSGDINDRIYNNTIYTHSNHGILIDAGATGGLIKNNIVYLSSGITNNASATLTTNLTTNPSFVNAGIDNYHLALGSAARNTGTALTDVLTDFNGVSRPQDGAYDIGAYEEPVAPQAPNVPAQPFRLRIAR